jgi:hypothetical protein
MTLIGSRNKDLPIGGDCSTNKVDWTDATKFQSRRKMIRLLAVILSESGGRTTILNVAVLVIAAVCFLGFGYFLLVKSGGSKPWSRR